jgi:cell division septation protein DedD
MSRRSCPLCRRLLSTHSAESAPATKLCEHCRRIVETAFRFGGSGAIAPAVQQLGTLEFADSPASIHQPIAQISPLDENPSFAESSLPPADDELDPDFILDFGPDSEDISYETESYFDAGGNGHRHHDDLSDEGLQWLVQANPGAAKDDELDDLSSEQHAAERAGTVSYSGSEAASGFVEQLEYPDSASEDVTSELGDHELNRWDYSNENWPVLVPPAKRRSSARRRTSIVTFGLLACAAGLYILINQPASPELPTRERAGSSATTQVAAVQPNSEATATDAQNQPPSSSDTSAAAASKPGDTSAGDAENPKVIEDSQFRFSLQAAAFPAQEAADEFAEKLKRAGLPAYVVDADLARRGKWFRVRVGRFKAGEDAQAFTREAQIRAKASGVSLQLIVCQYEQP